ncbi:hypothetical protein CRE_28553 [Caenorhabditis remanei]|uniref:Uncharacterized protein n=1 Tax=Caenorhabditis remanei TaxID=31234 RepID=E3LN07_CAERE|nr:hypothetical protein CRE_28553 [Caenorhabditis remanei]
MYRTRVLLRKVVTSAIQPASSSSYMPSAAFMYGKVRRPGQKEHFVKVASELELFKDVYGLEALDRLEIKDETWEVLMEMGWDERFIYLIDLMEYREKQNKESEKSSIKKELISEQNLKLWRAGNMVYARNFHSLVDIYGPDFRRKIDNFYGRNILKQGEDLRSFVVDCRFMREFSVKTQAYFTNQMQALHEDNWTSNLPFSVNFVNYQADQQLVSIAKRNLLFQYGPSSKSVNFQRHPFVPVITPRRVDSVIEKENLLYISPRATQFVPEVIPSEIKGVVICLSNDTSPSTSSHSACINERVQPYQLPFKRIISSPTFRPQGVQLWQYARIFRQYFAGSTIDESIRQNMDNLLRKRSLNEPVKDKDDKQEVQSIFSEASRI